tara:strand:+ start:799 stop:1812 length:1014 start_codon:yes stop_codon:yes gene_type:complete
MIAIYDLAEYEEHIKYVRETYIENGGLVYGWKANSNLPFDQGHWNRPIIKRSKYFRYDAAELPHFTDPAVSDIWASLNEQLGGRALVRAYINGYTYGTDGYVHVDDHPTTSLEDGQSETIIVYLNDIWNANWAGETIVLDGDQEIAKSVLPKKNRAFIFDSHLLHAARPVSRACTELRSVLVYKTANKEMYDSPAVKWLLKNATQEHTGRNLFQHLWFTLRLLELNGFCKSVCGAGLFHSVYGTKDWEAVTTSDRDTVKSFIGDYAESLVWEFHKLKDRYKDILEGDYSDEMRQNLMAISWANSLEQNPIGPKAYLHQQWEPHLKAVDFTKQKYLFL